MSVRTVDTNLFYLDCDIIVHQVNCQCKMGIGIAKDIKTKYPNVFTEYVHFCNLIKSDIDLLGRCQIVKVEKFDKFSPQYVANLFGQQYYGSGALYTSYEALESAFKELLGWVNQNYKNETVTIGIPYKIGCGLAGGDWDIVNEIILDIFDKTPNINVIICKFKKD